MKSCKKNMDKKRASKQSAYNKRQIRALRKAVYNHYRLHARNLPWRRACTPYRIFISEIMLQQTQVERVIDKYKLFIRAFPSFASLSQADMKDVLSMWQGLGYNRRAMMLWKCAKLIRSKYRGKLPRDPAILQTLPGIGPATAASIAAYAYNTPAIFIETNIRTVFIHHFFAGKSNVADAKLIPLIEQALDIKNPSRWYNALMDYGVMLKKKHANPSRKSAHYTRQSRFEGSDRQIRGKILKLLLDGKSVTLKKLQDILNINSRRCERNAKALVNEGFLQKRRSYYYIV